MCNTRMLVVLACSLALVALAQDCGEVRAYYQASCCGEPRATVVPGDTLCPPQYTCIEQAVSVLALKGNVSSCVEVPLQQSAGVCDFPLDSPCNASLVQLINQQVPPYSVVEALLPSVYSHVYGYSMYQICFAQQYVCQVTVLNSIMTQFGGNYPLSMDVFDSNQMLCRLFAKQLVGGNFFTTIPTSIFLFTEEKLTQQYLPQQIVMRFGIPETCFFDSYLVNAPNYDLNYLQPIAFAFDLHEWAQYAQTPDYALLADLPYVSTLTFTYGSQYYYGSTYYPSDAPQTPTSLARMPVLSAVPAGVHTLNFQYIDFGTGCALGNTTSCALPSSWIDGSSAAADVRYVSLLFTQGDLWPFPASTFPGVSMVTIETTSDWYFSANETALNTITPAAVATLPANLTALGIFADLKLQSLENLARFADLQFLLLTDNGAGDYDSLELASCPMAGLQALLLEQLTLRNTTFTGCDALVVASFTYVNFADVPGLEQWAFPASLHILELNSIWFTEPFNISKWQAHGVQTFSLNSPFYNGAYNPATDSYPYYELAQNSVIGAIDPSFCVINYCSIAGATLDAAGLVGVCAPFAGCCGVDTVCT